MALIHTDGFETYGDRLEAETRCPVGAWTSTNSAQVGVGVVTARTGTSALYGANVASATYTVPGPNEHATIIVGVAVFRSATSALNLLEFYSDTQTTLHVAITARADQGLDIKRGATILASSPGGVFPVSGYFYLETKVVLDDVAGAVEVRLNGAATPTVSFAGDTRNGGTKTVLESVRFGLDGNQRYDDFYVLNGAGAAPYNDFIGEVRCYPLLPNGNGNSSQLLNSAGNSTNNYSYVDETAPGSGDADYVGSGTNDQQDTYVHADITATTGTVLDVKLSQRAYKSDGATRSFAPVVRSGGADAVGTDTVLSTSAQRFITDYKTNPVTAAAWTNIAEANGAEFGFRVRP